MTLTDREKKIIDIIEFLSGIEFDFDLDRLDTEKADADTMKLAIQIDKHMDGLRQIPKWVKQE